MSKLVSGNVQVLALLRQYYNALSRSHNAALDYFINSHLALREI